MKPLFVGFIFLIGGLIASEADDQAPLRTTQASTEDLRPPHNMVELARTFSIDYEAILEGCLQSEDLMRRKKSLSVMLWLSAFGNFGGEPGEEHAGRIGEIMNKIGDESFAELLSGQPDVLRTAAGREIAYSYALFEPDAGKEKVAEFERRYPRTFKVLQIGRIVAAENNSAEQGGAGQPATRAESK